MSFLASDIDLSSLLKSKKKITNVLIIILAIIIGLNIYSRQNKVNLGIKDKLNLENKRNKLLNKLSASEVMISDYRNLLVNKDLTSVINSINQLARDSRIKIVSVRPQREQDFNIYNKLSVGVFLLAENYHKIGDFISKLESSTDVYKIEALKIIPAKKLSGTIGSGISGDIGNLHIEVIISRFFFKG